ncbi:hypothetical protein HYT02_06025 [Candidatus Gottesmanbacteria bacterium]|nr:hypothetical protein [Candidatus Gottesmanbacteria bacterium]
MELKQGQPIQKVDDSVNYSPPPKSRLPFIIIITLIVVIILGTSFYLGLNKVKQDTEPAASTQSQPTTFISPTPDPTENWMLFSDTNLGAAFKYPSNWEISSSRLRTDGVYEVGLTDTKYLASECKGDCPFFDIRFLSKENVENKDLISIIQNDFNEMTGGYGNLADLKIEDLELDNGTKFTKVIGFPGGAFYYLYAIKDNNVFTIYPTISSTGVQLNTKKDEANLQTFNQILSTFQFLYQGQTDELNNWPIYTNSEQGYSVKYPSDWKVVERNTGYTGELSRATISKNDTSPFLNIITRNDISKDDYQKSRIVAGFNVEDVPVSGVSGLKFTQNPTQGEIIWIVDPGKSRLIEMIGQFDPSTPEIINTYKQIISTFKLTE